MNPESAIRLARDAHMDAVDKAGRPYIEHIERVVARLPRGASDELRIAAALHDVLEDTDLTADDLRATGCPEPVVDAVLTLTRRAGETYLDFIRRVRANPIARAVKRADLRDNADEARLAYLDPQEATRLRQRYIRALAELNR